MNESVELIVAKIEELIIATGGKIEAYYPYVVREMIIGAVLPIIGMFIAIPLLIKGIREGERKNWEDGAYFGFVIAGGIGSVLSVLTSFAYFSQLLNPHYHAVQRIIEMGSNLVK